MKDFGGKLAVITGGGTGMGRELARQLIAEGCDVAICDVIVENMEETRLLCEAEAPQGRVISTFQCDVSNEEEVQAWRKHVESVHGSQHINLLFNNAGVGGGGSMVGDPREAWERTFNICWYGVYNCTRVFMPMLVASDEGHLINTSSVNGFWATLGPQSAHSAYSAAKFAVKGFSEALITDFRNNAPHLKVSVVMPGHIGTSIAINSGKILGSEPDHLSHEQLDLIRTRMESRGIPTADFSNDQLVDAIKQQGIAFRDNAPLTAAQAATIILDGVKAERWRILVGDDAQHLDAFVRETPEEAYEESFMVRLRESAGWGLG